MSSPPLGKKSWRWVGRKSGCADSMMYAASKRLFTFSLEKHTTQLSGPQRDKKLLKSSVLSF